MPHFSILSPDSDKPDARAHIVGSAGHPAIGGTVDFYSQFPGTVVIATLWGLPFDHEACAQNILGMHIHSGTACGGKSGAEPFSQAGGHFNPRDCPHPAHAGDLPPLFSCRGFAWTAVYTEGFTVDQVMNRTVIIHSRRDDFTSQPAGDAGERIGCGIIAKVL